MSNRSSPNPKRAKREDWKIQSLPQAKEEIRFERKFSEEELGQIAQGFIPDSMDDKWFIFLEHNRLYFHRSWTGQCIYELEINTQNQTNLLWANRDPKQYKFTDAARDIEVINKLIDHLLLEIPWSES